MVILAFLLGLVPGLIIISPAEWLVHKYMLHTPKEKRTWVNRLSSIAHNDVHHAAFKGPAHYYRDIVNEHVVIHFSWHNVILILGTAVGVGLAINRFYTLFTPDMLGFGLADGVYVLGLVIAVTIGYLGYEINHHYMHVIGERRLTINRIIGDIIQGGREKRDGKLRFPKPFLDTCCNTIERTVDRYMRNKRQRTLIFEKTLTEKFNKYMIYNSSTLRAYLKDVQVSDVFRKTTSIMIGWEQKKRSSFGTVRKLSYWIDRRVQWLFRGSPVLIGGYFRHIDNNHFMHHYRKDINLNVFLTWADKVFETRRDSSTNTLENDKEYWLCPNSPDTKKFSLNN